MPHISFLRALRLLITLMMGMLAPTAWPQDVAPQSRLQVGTYQGVEKIAVAADGSLFAVQAADAVTVYETKGGMKRFHLSNARLPGDSCFSPDDKRLLLSHGKKAEIVETAQGKTVTTLHLILRCPPNRLVTDLPGTGMYCGAFSPDGRRVAVGYGFLYHMSLHLYDTTTGKVTREMLNDVDGVAIQIGFSPDGSVVLVNHGLITYLLDTETGRELRRLHYDVRHFWFAPDARDGRFYYLVKGVIHTDYARSSPPANLPEYHAVDMPLLPSMNMLNAGTLERVAIVQGDDVLLHNWQGAEVGKMSGEGRHLITCLAFSADGKIMIVGRITGLAEVWPL
jgi:WD40 repeat protein